MSKKIIFILTLLFSSVSVARADTFAEAQLHGLELKSACNHLGEDAINLVPDGQPFNAGLCLGYIIGYLDSFAFNQFETPKQIICLPIGITNPQIISVLKKWLNDHPERLHKFVYEDIRDALSDAFPCSR